MKSIINKLQLLAILLAIAVVIIACTPAAPLPTSTPVSTATHAPTSTFTPLPTLTETVTFTPTPFMASVTKNAVLYSGPGIDGYENIASLTVGSNVELLGRFEDFVFVRLHATENLQEGYVPSAMLNEIPSDLPSLSIEEVPWKVLKTVATREKPIEQENHHNYWQELTLLRDLTFDNALEIELDIESTGGNGLLLTSSEGGGNPWWKGTKRMETTCEDGTLGVFLRDGTTEEMTFSNNRNRPAMPTSNGATLCQITLKFDKNAKSIQIFQDNHLILSLHPEDIGDFQGGLFPNGKILRAELTSSPMSGDKFSAVKLTELVFYVPPDGKYQGK